MVILKGKVKDILKQILENKEEEMFFIKTKIGKRVLYALLEFTNARKIVFSKGVYKQIPKRYIEAIKKTGVEVKVKTLRRGRREIHPWKEVGESKQNRVEIDGRYRSRSQLRREKRQEE